MKIVWIFVRGLLSKTVKMRQQNEINCDLNQLNIPKNSNGWICEAAEHDLHGVGCCKLDCFLHFQIKQGFKAFQNDERKK